MSLQTEVNINMFEIAERRLAHFKWLNQTRESIVMILISCLHEKTGVCVCGGGGATDKSLGKTWNGMELIEMVWNAILS